VQAAWESAGHVTGKVSCVYVRASMARLALGIKNSKGKRKHHAASSHTTQSPPQPPSRSKIAKITTTLRLPLLLPRHHHRCNRRRHPLDLRDREAMARRHLRRGSVHLCAVGLVLEHDGRRLHGARRAGATRDLEHIDASEAVLDVSAVEADDALDGVEIRDADVQRVLDDHEGDALCARRRRQRARVRQHVRGRELGLHVAEVDACGDGCLGAGRADGGERGRQRADDGRRVGGRDLEHERDDGELGVVAHALVHHVHFERVVLAVDVVLRRRVHVELHELEVGAADGGGAVDDDFDGCAEVLEFDFLLGDRHLWLLCEHTDGGV
jgi:hypothetical protein